jgi:thioesterase domain-containing protein
MEGYERSYRHHVAIARAYRPGPTDLEVLLLDPADTSQDDPGSFPSWTTVAGAVDRRTVPGNHFTMLDAQHVATVVRQLLRPHRPIAAHGVDRHAKGGGS